MEKNLYEFKRFGHKIHLLVQKEAKRKGIDFMAGPQGRVLHFIAHRDEAGETTLIKDIEQNLSVTKSVASNLVKRMEANGLIYLEPSPTDKRAKFVHLTDKAKDQVHEITAFFDEIDDQLVKGISDEDLETFKRVLHQFSDNLEKIGESHD